MDKPRRTGFGNRSGFSIAEGAVRFPLVLLAMMIGGAVHAQNAPVPMPCDVKDFAKGVDSYRIVTAQVMYANCGRTNLLQFDTTATLYEGAGGDRKRVDGVTVLVRLFSPEDPWIRIDFSQSAGGQVLEKGKDYELDLAPDQRATVVAKVEGRPASMVGPFEKLTISFSTKPAATVKPSNVSSLGVSFEIFSSLALQPFNEDGPIFAEISALRTKTYHKAKTTPEGSPVPACAPGAICPPPDPFGDNPETFGRARVTLTADHLQQPKATLMVDGLNDFFGDTLKMENDVTLGAVPKTKDDSMWYLKLDHQAGPGSKPGYAIEAKLAPQLGRPTFGGFTWKPALNMDIGNGTVNNVKTNDTIIPSLGLTQLFRLESTGLEAVRVTPALSFETNKELNKENLIYDQDFQFLVGPLNASRLVRAWDKYNQLKKDPKNKDLKFSNELSNWGAGIQLFAGGEVGGALGDQTVKASKSSNSVTVPTYTVARIRPKISAYGEYKRINLTFSVLPRYLFTTEYTTRQSSDGKTIALVPVSGFRPYGEASLNIGLDESGHVSLNTTYKLGSQPPTFQSTNVVQTGLLLKY
jgi:hypothetical protein